MHTYVYCSTVYDNKDLEPTQMPNNDRMNKENVAHIYHGILCNYKKDEKRYFFANGNQTTTSILISEKKVDFKIKTTRFASL